MWWTEWIIRAEPFAYAELGLTADQFGSMTIAEFNLRKRAYYRLRRRDLERQAGWVALIVNHYPMRGKGAKALRIEQMIGFSEEQLREIQQKRKQREAERDRNNT